MRSRPRRPARVPQTQQALVGQPTLGASPAWDPARIRGFVGVRCADLAACFLPAAARSRRRLANPNLVSLPLGPTHFFFAIITCTRSGAYNLYALADHLHKRGLYRNMFEVRRALSRHNRKPAGLAVTLGARCSGGAMGGQRRPMLLRSKAMSHSHYPAPCAAPRRRRRYTRWRASPSCGSCRPPSS